MPETQFWSFKQANSATDLYLLGEIAGAQSWWGDEVTPAAFRGALFGVKGELRVWLDSPGGDAFAGAAIHDMLREYSASGRGKTIAMVSLAASAASLIAMACDEIRISVVGTMMIHEPWSLTQGKASELRATAEVLDSIREAQISAYARRTGNPREKIVELMTGSDGNGTYMNAAQAIENGFADSIIGEEESIDAIGMARSMVMARIDRSMTRADSNLQEAIAARAAAEDAAHARAAEARSALLRACLTTYDNEETEA